MPEIEKTTDKLAKDRSPNFPSISLKEAIERVKMIYDADKMSGSPRESVFKHLGYGGANGASLGVLGALKQFDLIREENKRIFVTENARTILLLPENDERRKKAIKLCALSPRRFKEVLDRYRENGIPSDDTIKTDLIYDSGFNDKSAQRFIFTFRQTLEFAGIDEETSEGNSDEEIPDYTKELGLEKSHSPQTLIKSLKQTPNMTPLSIPYTNGKIATLLMETPVSKADIGFIKSWLELFEKTLALVQPEATANMPDKDSHERVRENKQ